MLILAPRGRDAALASQFVGSLSLRFLICADMAALRAALGEDTCFCIMSDEEIRGADLRGVSAFVAEQPSWSDLPMIVLTRRGGGDGPARGGGLAPAEMALPELLGNVTFLERPFHPATFLSILRSAVKARRRQFEARARIAELHESEERLSTALQAGHLGSWELDIANLSLSSSATCKALFGRGPGEAFTYDDLLASTAAEDRAALEGAVRAAIDDRADVALELRARQPGGGVRWAEIRARPVQDRRRGFRLVGVTSDITDRKLADEVQRSLNEMLEERVAQRTAELKQAHAAMLQEIAQRERAEEELRQTRKLEMIGQFTGGVAHDFNNLLMAVLGNLELLAKHHAGDARALRLIEGARQGAQRGATLTQRLLAFARRQELQVATHDIPALVRGMSDLLERSLGAGVELSLHLPQSPACALVDAGQVELAILNLAINARDAMPRGGALRLAVEACESADARLAPGRYVRISVADTGEGMDAETLERATEPFFSTKELGKGTGLGLSMVHGLAMQLNGALRLESEKGRGTRAELWLPLASPAIPASSPHMAQEADSRESFKVTILVVDDDALISMSTVDMLEDLGHTAIEANSGAEALEILRSDPEVELLITDYSMPQMTGAQLARAALELRPDLPILLATGYAELPPGSDIELPRLGKPYQQAQLATEIAKILGRRAA